MLVEPLLRALLHQRAWSHFRAPAVQPALSPQCFCYCLPTLQLKESRLNDVHTPELVSHGTSVASSTASSAPVVVTRPEAAIGVLPVGHLVNCQVWCPVLWMRSWRLRMGIPMVAQEQLG